MVTSSRRAGRVTNKTKLVIYRGSDKVDLGSAEVIVWENNGGGANGNHDSTSSSEGGNHQHVGAKGVESGELLEYHLQAALSSASLLHSRPAKPSSPSHSRHTSGNKPDPNPSAAYHIPTPDATGLIDTLTFNRLYPPNRYVEPNSYVRFSDTVEEASGGWGGLGYCLDDEDAGWLKGFNSKAEGSSGSANGNGNGEAGVNGNGNGNGHAAQSPLRESRGENSMPPPGVRPSRGKGKEREKDGPAPPVFISEDTFEYVMGVLEKHAADSVPMLHTDLALLPPFSSVEPLFANAIPSSFLPSNEIPNTLPPLKELTRMARCIYPHWKSRREKRKGRTIMPILNYDESNDGDPYVCFRRRDTRATRKTRRTDNFSVERMQKLQYELRSAQNLATLTLRRETEKLAQYRVEREVWEAKWKLFETKRRWPSLGMSREEEEMITGRSLISGPGQGVVMNGVGLGGRDMLGRKKEREVDKDRNGGERDKERERRERLGEINRNGVGREVGPSMVVKSMAPESIKERQDALKQKVDEELAKKKEADAGWDDATDASYQPLPKSTASHSFRPITDLDPNYARRQSLDPDPDAPTRPAGFRLRRGRGGMVRLDRNPPSFPLRKGKQPKDGEGFGEWLFPDTFCGKGKERERLSSIDDAVRARDESEEDEDGDGRDVETAMEIEMNVEAEAVSSKRAKGDGEEEMTRKRKRLDEIWRYDVDRGGAVGVGMGFGEDEDRVVIDDLDPKYIRHRISLLKSEDFDRLRPDHDPLHQAVASLKVIVDMPLAPKFQRPQPTQPTLAQMQQQQMLQQQQQQMENFHRFSMLAQQQVAQQQVAVAQQQQHALAQAQANATMSTGSNSGRPSSARKASSQNVNTSMPPPPQPRPSMSPTNSMHGQPLAIAGNPSPQLINGMLQPNKTGSPFPIQPMPNGQQPLPQPQQAYDPMIRQRLLQAHALAQAQLAATANINGTGSMDGQPQVPQMMMQSTSVPINTGGGEQMTAEQYAEIVKKAQAAGYGNDVPKFLDMRNRAKLIGMQKRAESQAAQAQGQAAGTPGPSAAVKAQGQAQGQGKNTKATAKAQGGSVSGGSSGPAQNQSQGQGQGPNFTSPTVTQAQLNLKLPAHAAARLGASQASQAAQRVG